MLDYKNLTWEQYQELMGSGEDSYANKEKQWKLQNAPLYKENEFYTKMSESTERFSKTEAYKNLMSVLRKV